MTNLSLAIKTFNFHLYHYYYPYYYYYYYYYCYYNIIIVKVLSVFSLNLLFQLENTSIHCFFFLVTLCSILLPLLLSNLLCVSYLPTFSCLKNKVLKVNVVQIMLFVGANSQYAHYNNNIMCNKVKRDGERARVQNISMCIVCFVTNDNYSVGFTLPI